MVASVDRFYQLVREVELFGRLARWVRVSQKQDAYAASFESKLAGVVKVVQDAAAKPSAVVVVCYFPATFFEVQSALDAEGIDYQLVSEAIVPSKLNADLQQSDSPKIILGLADLFENEQDSRTTARSSFMLNLISCERHPLRQHEDRIRRFAESIGCQVLLGRLASLEDPTVQPFMGEWTEMVIQQLGFGEDRLMYSELISRRLERGYRRLGLEIETEVAADSPREWMKLNVPEKMRARLNWKSMDPT